MIADIILSAAMLMNFLVHVLCDWIERRTTAELDPFEQWADCEGRGALESLERDGDGRA